MEAFDHAAMTVECTNLDCHAPAIVIVAPQIALCGPHGLEWYAIAPVAKETAE